MFLASNAHLFFKEHETCKNFFIFFLFIFLLVGAERVLHLRLEMPDELPPLIIEMLDRQENVCIP